MTGDRDRPRSTVGYRYFAVVDGATRNSADPRVLVRLPRGAAGPTAEALTPNGSWGPSDVLEEVTLGMTLDDVVELSGQQAGEVAARWAAAGTLHPLPGDPGGVSR